MTELRTPPHDLIAEQAVIGACLMSARMFDEVTHVLSAADFYRPGHATLWLAMERMKSAHKPIDAVSVLAELQATQELADVGGGPYLHTLCASVTVAANAMHYAGIVIERSRRRQLIENATRTLESAYEAEDVEQAIDAAADAVARMQSEETADDLTSLMNVDQFISQPLPVEEWVVPDLLARGDRLVLTGAEGLGKSMLMRQLAICAAAGLHPFRLTPSESRTVLVIDAENPARIMIDRFEGLMKAAVHRGRPVSADRLWIDRRPGGLDLADVKDRRWLRQRVRTVQPDLLVIGPVYKLYIGGEQKREEDLARLVTSVLDDIRQGCALILEHHSPHAGLGASREQQRTVRPIGSSLWMRWPEFGYGIRLAQQHPDAAERRIVDLASWRGPRDERPWPPVLRSGLQSHGWPWVEFG